MPFQTAINITQAPAIAGDFASANPRHSAVSSAGGFVAGASGVTVGTFVWLAGDGITVNNTGTGAPNYFIHREINATIAVYLAETGNVIPAGFGVGSLFDGGDFWAKNTGAGAVTVGQKAFAKLADGTIQFGNAGATISNYIETKWFAKTAGAAGELIKISDTP